VATRSVAPHIQHLPLPLTFTAKVRGRPLTYRVTVSPRATVWRLTVHPDSGLTVVLPARSRVDLAHLLESKATWIFKHLDRARSSLVTPRQPLEAGSVLRYLGGSLRLELATDADAPVLNEDAGVLRVYAPDRRDLPAIVEAWYRTRATAVIADRLRAVNARLGYRFARVAIRDQRTRWGSCSARGNLAFNWRLILAPEPVIDYVVAHELVHLIELSHSRAFWHRVAAIDPAYVAHRRWLRENSPHLVLGD
jgi:predicted metal-dependent hydrolase